MLSAIFLNCWRKLNRFLVFLEESETKKSFSNIFLIVCFVRLVNKAINRGSRPEVFCEKGLLKNIAKIKENTCVRVSFLANLQASGCNFIKEETLAQVFSLNFAKFLRIAFLTEHLRWLLLNKKYVISDDSNST